MNRKVVFWLICWLISFLYALSIISIPLFYIYFASDFESKKQLGEFIREYASQGIFRFAGLVSFVFWIYSIVVWNKRKDGLMNLLLLIFLNVIYAPVYYIRVIRNRK